MAEEAVTPISAAKPPAPANPLSPETTEHASTLKLKPVIRKPGAAGAAPAGVSLLKRAAAAAPAAAAASPSAPPAGQGATSASAMDKLKNITQQLKGITSQLPQQAILHKTGIIADQNLSDAQKAASKSRTARISLSDAFGVAPVKDEGAPLKTIRIKRPENLQRHPAGSAPAGVAGLKPVPPGALKPVSPDATPAPAAEEEDSDTKRRTLKVVRPGVAGGEDTDTKRRTLKVARPSAKLAPRKAPAPAPAKAAAAEDDIPDIEDIPDINEPPKNAAAVKAGGVKDVPQGLLVFDTILQIAACVAMGVLGWLLYTDWSIAWF